MLSGHPVNIQGFEIPSDTPWFLALIAVHVLCGLTCVVAGLIAMLAKKQQGRHPKAGTVYFWSLSVVFTTATLIAVLRWKEDYHLFILGFFAFSTAYVARKVKRENWKKWSVFHIAGMGVSYIFLLTAFYVDNGKFLPLWKDFNPIVYWTLPAVVGIPIIIRTLLRHPLSVLRRK